MCNQELPDPAETMTTPEVAKLFSNIFETKLRLLSKYRRSQYYIKKDVVKNFITFTGKYLCWSLFLIK